MKEMIFQDELKVLIVEDSPTQSDNLKYLLEKTGMQVLQCYNGSEALKLLENVRPNLIISDIMMPEMNGIEFCTLCKADSELKDIPLVILTHLDSIEDILNGLAAGADGYVMKPYDRQNLVARIRQVFDNLEYLNSDQEEDPLHLTYNDKQYVIRANGAKILSMLFSSYESAKIKSADLKEKKEELLGAGNLLKKKVEQRNKELKVQLNKIQNTDTEIRRFEKRYQELIENALVGIVSLDNAGNIIQANMAFLEMIGKAEDSEQHFSFRELFADEDSWEEFREAVDSRQSVEEYETHIRIEEGIEIEISINAFLDGGDISCMVMDITEQKEEERKLKSIMDELISAKEKAAQSESVKTSFLANMSDRILQPVRALTLQAEQIDNDEQSTGSHKEHLSEIGNIANYISNLIESTIDVAMIEAKEAVIKLEDCFINQLLIDLFAAQQKKMEDQGAHNIELRLRREIKDPGFIIKIEGYRLKRIFQNLLSRSLKYTTKGVIEFGYKVYSSTPGEEGVMLFYVKDTGVGMPEQRVRHIFDRFGAGEEEGRKNDYHAAGFGLSLSRGYVEMLGGRIWCESEPEKGTEFYFTHPVKIEDPDLSVSFNGLVSKSLKLITRGRNMLLSEHTDEQFDLLQRMIKPLNINIDRAITGKELIDRLKSEKKYDLLFIDLKSSIVTGHELVREIRRLKNKVPVIVRSSFFTDEEKHLLRELGCDHLVTKPVDPNVLYTMIGSAL